MNTETTIEQNVQQVVPLFGVKDMQSAVKYYTKGLGFNMTHQWMPDGKLRWCNLQRDSANLMLQEFLKEGKHANVPKEKTGVGVSINFICNDALALYNEFIARNIAVEEPFVGNNMWVIHLTDPDGYDIYFESFTDVPEETKYSEWRREEGSLISEE